MIPVLHNIRSTYNVGAILRTCECLGITEVALSGYTPRHNDPTLLPHLRDKLNHQIAKTALGAETLVKQELVDDLAQWLNKKHQQGYLIVGLENNLSSDELPRRLVLGQNPLPPAKNLILLLGEEVHGIPADLRQNLDFFLEIPMRGQKESFNVSAATAIALWELQKTL